MLPPRTRQVRADDTYVDKVKKLLPAEVSAAFLAINSSIPPSDNHLYWAIGLFVLLIPICWLYLKKFQRVENWMQLAFTSLIAFPIWSVNIAIDRFDDLATIRFVPGAILIIISLVAPLLSEINDGGQP